MEITRDYEDCFVECYVIKFPKKLISAGFLSLTPQWLARCAAMLRSWLQCQTRVKFIWKIPAQRRTQPTQLWWVDLVFTWSKVRRRGSVWPSSS